LLAGQTQCGTRAQRHYKTTQRKTTQRKTGGGAHRNGARLLLVISGLGQVYLKKNIGWISW